LTPGLVRAYDAFALMVRRLLPLFALSAEATPAQRIAVRLDDQPPDTSDGCPRSDELAAEFAFRPRPS